MWTQVILICGGRRFQAEGLLSVQAFRKGAQLVYSKNSRAITVAVANVGKRRGQKVWV